MAKGKLPSSQVRLKMLFDRRAEPRQFSPEDQVLALLPIVGSPLQATFSGPCTVVCQLSDLIATLERRKANQLCNVNLLKPYYAHLSSELAKTDVVSPVLFWWNPLN